NDGGATWAGSITFDINALTNGTYVPLHVNMDSLMAELGIAYTNDFIVRFQEYDDADFNTSGDEDGFYIDDVCISGSGVGMVQPINSTSSTCFPNPTSGSLRVRFPQRQINTVNVRNALGQVVS